MRRHDRFREPGPAVSAGVWVVTDEILDRAGVRHLLRGEVAGATRDPSIHVVNDRVEEVIHVEAYRRLLRENGRRRADAAGRG